MLNSLNANFFIFFFKPKLHFLGHVVGANGVQVNPDNIKAVLDWVQPTSVTEVRSFLGLTKFFGKFVQGYSALVAPLTNLTRASVPVLWNSDCQARFDSLKALLSSAPVLAIPDVDKPFEVWCDASGFAVGALLLQNGRPCAYESRKLNGPKLNYHPGETELLAVIHALKVWRCYLKGNTAVTVCTDHNPLVYLQTQPTLSPKQVRWVGYMQRFLIT
jgi:hypothetical protein